ncbi:hypothetical protein [Streptomyces scopuliridis]|uniref:hypothetical protein n=1 Tax=Streptomyces scopuliridis TaxID=452529 RepID=UPI0034172B34
MSKKGCLATVAAALAFVLSGCSGGGSDGGTVGYSVPKSLCGVTVDPKLLEPFLPAGKQLAVKEDEPVADAITTCELSIDDAVVVSIERERREPGASPRDIAVNQLNVGNPEESSTGGYVYSDRIAVSVVRCDSPRAVAEDLSSIVKVLKPGIADKSAMKSFIASYTTAYKKQQPCRDENGSPAPTAP